ncbi:MAG: hypothetical protein FWB96_13430 [Defluviitaleaceae bacterium]|nr:hypothetical protein [Defluviitaleaceae bacterium]MCL2264316.1 hypothetical protein [Defluviitaleaceae bacterium]
MENYVSIEAKLKKLVLQAFCFAAVAAVVIPVAVLLLQSEDNASMFAIGGIVAAGIILALGCLVLMAKATEHASEIISGSSHLAKSASAMAVGNFNERLRTDVFSELGQIEGALAQLSEVQTGLAKDIDKFTRAYSQGNSAAAIDEKLYSGNYREIIRGINSAVSGLEKSSENTANTAKALVRGEYRATYNSGRKTEADNALEELRKKMETINGELQDAQKALALAKNEADDAKREVTSARQDLSRTRDELSAANAEVAAAKREVAAARRGDSGRATSAPRPAISPMQRATTAPPPRPMPPRPTTPSPASQPLSSLCANDDQGSAKSVKITAPSGAHEYDRKDYGKY